MHKKVLITGASGLCGSYITNCLQDRVGLYSIYTTSRRDITKKNHIVHDLFDPLKLDIFPPKVDCVIHCAANVDERDSTYKVINDNLRSSFNVLKYVLETKPECFIHLSSISVYGKPRTSFPVDENFSSHPLTSYGLSKLLVETLSEVMLSSVTRVINLRLGYVLAPRIPSRYVLARFRDMLSQGKPIQLINPDSTRFSFIDVYDVANICEIMINTNQSGIFNLVGDEAPTLREVFEEIKKYFPRSHSAITESNCDAEAYPVTFSNKKLKQIIAFSLKGYRISFQNIFEEAFRER